MDQTTNWYLKLREIVSAPLRKITDLAGGAQKKVASVANATKDITKNSNTMGREVRKNLEGLQGQLVKLQGLQAKAWDPKHIHNYEKAIIKTREEIAKWNSAKNGPAIVPPKPSWMSGMKAKFGEAISSSPIGGLVDMLKNPALLAAGAAAMFASFSIDSAKASMVFEHGMSKINATAQLPIDTLGKLKGRLLDIGEHSGGNFDNITAAYEKILSTTGKVNLSLDITETAVKGAKAGFADIDLVAGALAQTLASVGHQNATANEVMDTLLKAKAVGAGEFADFAQYLPSLIASGRNLGVTFKDTAGLFSFMTYKGQSAADSAMLIQNAFTALQKKDMIVNMKEKGIDLFNVNGSRKNIQKVFTELSEKMKGMTDKQKTKFLIDISLMDAQARQAFSVLTSDASEFKRVMNEVNDSLGETDRQLAATADRTRTWGDIGDQWKRIGVDFGDALMPVVDALSAITEGLVVGLKEIMKGDMFNMLGTDEKSKNLERQKTINEGSYNAAETAYTKKYGAAHSSLKESINPEHQQDYNKMYKVSLEAYNRLYGKNKIDPNEDPNKPSRDAAKLLNTVDNTDFGKSKKDKEGNSGLRTLIMNIEINNEIHTKEEAERFKRKFTDDLVDAARDGIVTVGME